MIKKYPHSKSLKTNQLFINVLFNKIKSVPKNFILLLLIFLGSNFAYCQLIDSTPGVGKTFNVPTGVTSVTASAWGAGGGGGGSSANNNGGNGGGGGGATSSVIAVLGGSTSFTYTVGAAGAAGAAGTNPTANGGNGGFSSITCTLPTVGMTANGGTGGLGNKATANFTTNSGGGTATGGTTNASGLPGVQGDNQGRAGGNSGTVISLFGAGGNGSNGNVGSPGNIPGGGGGGGEGNPGMTGGLGGVGQVIFNYIGVTSISPSPACIGSTITITGFNFAAGATTVSINSTACTSVTRVDANTITAVVAAGTTSGTVVITNPNGTNNGQTLTINTLPANPGNPTSNSPQCASPGVTLTRNGTPPVGVTWYWQTTALGTSTTDSGTTYVATTTGTYYIRAQNDATGCWSAASGSLAIVANVLPADPGNPTSNSPQCLPTGVTITRSGAPPGGVTWYWQTTSLGTSTTSNSTTPYVVTTSGTYYIRARNNTTFCWSSGEGSITVVVNPLPANPPNPTSNSPQCPSPGVTLTRTGTPPAGETWYWQTTALGTATTDSGSTYTATTTNTYYIRAQNDATGCWSAASGSLAITINPLPANPGNPTSNTPQCLPTGVTLTRSGTPPGGVVWYWQTTALGTDTSNSGNTYTVTSSGTYYIRAQTTATGCWSAASGSLAVVVNALPADPGNPTSNSPQCLPTGVTLTRNGTPPGGETWYWQTTSLDTSTVIGSAATYVVTTSGTYYIRARNNTTLCWSSGEGSLAVVVNPLPANPGNPTSNSPQCASPGVTLTRNGTPPVGVTWYWQTTALGTSTTDSGTTYVATTTGTYYIRAQNDATGCWSAASGSLAITITASTLTAPITPSPTAAATGICYTGVGAVTSISWAAVGTATSYDVYFGAGSVPGTVTANVATNSYTTGTLLANTTYSWRVVPRNSCGPGTTSATWTFTTKSSPCYCTPTGSNVDGDGITRVVYSSVNNPTTGNSAYNDYTATQIGNAVQGAAMPIAVTTSTGNKEYNIYIYVDWNNDADFVDAGETVFTGRVKSNTINGIINIPLTASIGYHTMRIGIAEYKKKAADNIIPTPCLTGTKVAYEDYTINVIADVCVGLAPTVSTNPVNSTVVNLGSTTLVSAFANTPTNYVWEVSSDGGTNFTTITNGGVYSTASTATLTLTGVTSAMNGFIYRVSASNACGTSAYSTLATLTVTVSYCSATSTSGTNYISGISSEGNLNDVANPSFYSTNGFGDYSSITIAKQIPGGGININIDLGGPTRQYIECYVDWNGDGTFTEPGEQVYNSSGTSVFSTSFGFVVPISQSYGNYRMRVRTKVTDATIVPCGAYSSGETEDYTIAIVPDCAALIDSVTDGSVCGANNPVTISAVGLGGTTKYRWYTSLTGGTYVETSTGTYSPTLSATQIYYVTAFNGSCESLVRTRVTAKVIPTANITFTPSSPVICGEDVVVAISAASDFVEQDIFTEDFEGTTIGLTATMPIGVVPTTAGADSPWSVKTSTYQPTSTAVWRPAINSGSIDNSFGFSSSDYSVASPNGIVTRYTTTSSYNTNSFVSLALSFDFYFSYYIRANETFKAQISLDNTNWVDLASYGSDQGSASRFKTETITIPNSYRNQTAVYLRFQYTSDGWSDGVAIDNIRFYGIKQLNTTFSWSSATPVSGYTDLACSDLYTNQLVSTIYLKPTLTQMEATSFPITVTATLANGCPITQVMTVGNNSRVWKGLDLVDAYNWNDADNWKPAAIPTIDNCVIIPNTSIVKGTAYQAYAKNLVVKSTGNLNVQPGNSITVKEWVNVNHAAGGVFELENTANLVQIDNVASNNNTGEIKYKRNTNLRRYDYTFLSSPVENQLVNSVTQAPLVTGPVYKWHPTIPNPNGGQGNWENALGDIMVKAKGYTVRSPDSFPFTTPTPYNGLFKGVPNNGIITIPVSRGTFYYIGPPYIGNNGTEMNTFSDNWNLIGNPYPSSIRGSQFLFDNRTKIDGSLYIWKHQVLPSPTESQPFYGSFGYNYTPNDYIPHNFSGSTCCPLAPNEFYVGAGQGFFVQMIDGDPDTYDVTFNNTLRNGTYDNSYFYRNAESSIATDTDMPIDINNIKRNRIWLDLVSSANQSSRILIGNIEGATNAKDNFFDALAEISGAFTFYSLIGFDKFFIQGRELPFNITDEVPLGIKVPTAGTYSLAIAAVDGYFVEKKVFLKDMLLNTVHNLKIAPYQFNSAAGQFDNRFKIVYHNQMTNSKTIDYENSVKVISNEVIDVRSSNEPIETITVYDILGRTLATYNKINSNEFTISTLIKNKSPLLLQIKLQNGDIVNQKVIY